MLLAPPVDDAGLTDACGEDPGAVCERVWDATGSEAWAKVADWFIGVPLTIVLVLTIAWIVARLARRGIHRSVRRVVMTNVSPGRGRWNGSAWTSREPSSTPGAKGGLRRSRRWWHRRRRY